MITIQINGKPQQIPPNTGLTDLLHQQGYTGKTYAVAINGEVIPKSQHQAHGLMADDAIEILIPAQGG